LDVVDAANFAPIRLTSAAGTTIRFDTTRNFTVNRNWIIGCDYASEGGFALIPSTALGGGTFSNPVYQVSAVGVHTWASGSTERMRIDSSGNVGIGTTGPSAKVHISGSSSTDFKALTIRNGDGTTGSAAVLGFEASTGALGDDSSLAGQIKGIRTGAGTSGALAFWTNNAGTPAERARIDSSGNLLVGTTSSNEAFANGFIVQGATKGYVATSMSASTNAVNTYHVYSTGAGAYRFYVGMGGTVFATSTTISAISDARLKENIQDIDVGLDAVMALKPRKFDWKEGKGKDIKGDRGWIAQEFEQVFPEMVGTWRDEPPEGEEPYKSVGADLIPVLVKAIQEQQQMIEELKAKVAALESA
jgi:hypothetical protein